MHTYLPMSPISVGSNSALLRFIGSVVTCRYSQQAIIIIIMNLIIKMGERQMVTRQGYGMGSGWCNRMCPVDMGHSLVALFPSPCRLRTVRCMDLGQVTDLLSQAHTCLWEREGLLLSYRGLRLFSDRLIEDGDRWRSKHHIEARPHV
jgi:hypothetical protein